MPFYRKKPVVIEAMQFPGPMTIPVGNDFAAFNNWLCTVQGDCRCLYLGESLIIPTLEGDHMAKPGDWIIKGVAGELYPCKPDIFAATYEPELVQIPLAEGDQAELDLDTAAQTAVEGADESETDLPEPTQTVADEARALLKRPIP